MRTGLLGAVLLCACAGPPVTEPPPVTHWFTRPAIQRPPGDWSASPLAGLWASWEGQRCSELITTSDALSAQVMSEVADVFGAAQAPRNAPDEESLGFDSTVAPDVLDEPLPQPVVAAELRSVLDRYVFVEPAVLTLDEHGFELPAWWSDALGYCQVAVGQYQEAASVYLQRLGEDPSNGDVRWRAALAYAWAGQTGSAMSLLERWPEGVEVPAELPSALERLHSGQEVPESIQLPSLPLD